MLQGELFGATDRVLNLDAGTLRVEQQLLTPAGRGAPHLTPLLKTRASRWVLPLPRFVLDALQAHLPTYGTGQDRLLFPNLQGRGWRRGSVNDSVWKPPLKRADLPTGPPAEAGAALDRLFETLAHPASVRCDSPRSGA